MLGTDEHETGTAGNEQTAAGGPRQGSGSSLRRWNLAVGAAHLVQAVVLLVLSTPFSIAVVAPVQTGPPGAPLGDPITVFSFPVAWGCAAFLALAGLDHLGVATWWRRRYEAGLELGRNDFRWVEYSVSSTSMVVMISLLCGITNMHALLGIAGANASMIGFGAVMEHANPAGADRVRWAPFWMGCGAVPWLAVLVGLLVASSRGSEVPGFVYGIVVSLFCLFNCFGLAQRLQQRGRGRFASYHYGEWVFIVLSLAAKSVLAWQVFGGTLAQ